MSALDVAGKGMTNRIEKRKNFLKFFANARQAQKETA
jgi:hypothetical protein